MRVLFSMQRQKKRQKKIVDSREQIRLVENGLYNLLWLVILQQLEVSLFESHLVIAVGFLQRRTVPGCSAYS